jgi:diguanylate cyclase (GGDEF)-like protein
MLAALQDQGSNNEKGLGEQLNPSAALQYARELSALHEATAALLTTLDLEALLGKILDAATSAIPAAENAFLYLIARDTGKLEMRAVLGYTETDTRIHKLGRPQATGYIASVISEGKPLLIQEQPQEISPQSIIVAPLIVDNQVLGAISLESPTPSAFTHSDLRLLASFAVTATAAIRNAELHAEVQRLAITDSLTGLYNRRGFFELGEREVERALRFNRPLAIIMLDVDHLKPINDTLGHAAGDCVLRFVGQQCRQHTRKIDIASRYGGDEFVILLPETDLFQAVKVAERLRDNIAETTIQFENVPLTTTISTGISKAFADLRDLDSLVKRADAALYAAKQAGRNQIVVQ